MINPTPCEAIPPSASLSVDFLRFVVVVLPFPAWLTGKKSALSQSAQSLYSALGDLSPMEFEQEYRAKLSMAA